MLLRNAKFQGTIIYLSPYPPFKITFQLKYDGSISIRQIIIYLFISFHILVSNQSNRIFKFISKIKKKLRYFGQFYFWLNFSLIGLYSKYKIYQSIIQHI